MKKTEFKNNFAKYFEQIVNEKVISITSNRTDTIQIKYLKENKEKLLEIKAHIQANEEGILEFSFNCNAKKGFNEDLEPIYENISTIDEMSLLVAKDMFCSEQALQIRYDTNKYVHILIYTNMVEMTLEFFDEKLEAEKFKEIRH